MAHKTITPDRDGWYWAIRDGLPQVDSNLDLVRYEYAGPIEPPELARLALSRP
jgi:hypothetical protein